MADQFKSNPTELTPSDKVLAALIILNSLATASVGGLFFYTKVFYQRPKITEKTERARLENDKNLKRSELTPGFLTFDPITVNLSQSYQPAQKIRNETDPTPEQKPHYVTLGLAIEIRDEKQKAVVESFRAFFLDELIRLLGRRTFEELVTVQGRYILNSQIIQKFNQHMSTKLSPPPTELLITHAYFTQFIVQ